MRNVFITGSGRSGTSMLAGAFRLTPAYLGARLYPPRAANPRGFFEDADINDINEAVIAHALAELAGEAGAEEIKDDLPRGQLWLASLPGMIPPTKDRELQKRIATQTAQEPFCFKDPRFSSTLNSWLPYGGDCVVLVIFRDPATTVESILKECRTAPYLRDLALSVDDAMSVWRGCYCRLLDLYLVHPSIRFVHYDHVLDGTAIPLIEELVGCELDRSFPTPELSRTRPSLPADDLCTAVYQVLRQIASEGVATTPMEERPKTVAGILQHPTIREEMSRGSLLQVRGIHSLATGLVRIRERQLKERGCELETASRCIQQQRQELESANRRIVELGHVEAERNRSIAAEDASRRKLRAMGARVRELRREKRRLHQEASFKDANLSRMADLADQTDRLSSELEQARERCAAASSAADARGQELAQMGRELSRLGQQVVELNQETTTLRSAVAALSAEKEAILRDLDEARRARHRIQRSLSWRMTKPFRTLLGGKWS